MGLCCAQYLRLLTAFSYDFTDLLAEALGLPAGALERYFDNVTRASGRVKVRACVWVRAKTRDLGIHRDSLFAAHHDEVETSPRADIHPQLELEPCPACVADDPLPPPKRPGPRGRRPRCVAW